MTLTPDLQALLADVEAMKPAPAVGVLRAYVDGFTAPDEYDDQEGAVAYWMDVATSLFGQLAAAVRELAKDGERLAMIVRDGHVYLDEDGQLVMSCVLLRADQTMDDDGEAIETLPPLVRGLVHERDDSEDDKVILAAIDAAITASGE